MSRLQSRAVALACLLVLLGTATGVHAQKLYLLIAADTSKQGGIYLSTGPDTGYVFDAFYAHVPERQLVVYGMGGPEGQPVWDGPDIRFDLGDMGRKLLGAIDACPAGPDDTIVFFYSGHGAHDDRGHYLLMPDQKTTLARPTLIRRIQAKNPRLAVVVTDTCSNLLDRGLLPGPEMMLQPPEQPVPLFDSLFFQSTGLVDLNSSTEGQVAAGPVGGGLLVLALAYLGNEPDFQRARIRGVTVEPIDEPGVSIPAMPYDEILAERFGWNEHGLHGGFDPDRPWYGLLWARAEERLTWPAVETMLEKQVDELFRKLHPEGMRVSGSASPQRTQTPQFYRLAKTRPAPRITWSAPTYRPEPGDRIVEVNGRPIRNTRDFTVAVKGSPELMTFRIVGARSGRTFLMRTRLDPPSARTRLGIGVDNDPRGGVRIRYVRAGHPGTRCQLAQ